MCKHRQKDRDWLEGDRKSWKEVEPLAYVPLLATVLTDKLWCVPGK